ncbi:hypothetical protein NQZ68_009076 [Dissostichus eleginoides]|nr:hypothetical protein NQZ68_009076 [Dissostichus eleginoides]
MSQCSQVHVPSMPFCDQRTPPLYTSTSTPPPTLSPLSPALASIPTASSLTTAPGRFAVAMEIPSPAP